MFRKTLALKIKALKPILRTMYYKPMFHSNHRIIRLYVKPKHYTKIKDDKKAAYFVVVLQYFSATISKISV